MTEAYNPEENFYNPFKGPDSYSEQDQFNFYGRESEKNELIKLLDQNTLTLLYSRSGIGKSSLLNAGLIPILKKSKFYFPVYVRLTDKLITKDTPTFSRAIIRMIIDAANSKEKKVTIKLSRPVTGKITLTEFLYSSQFSQFNEKEKMDESIVPVIIFDQFEEIFSLKFDSDINDLVNDLSYLIEGKIPGVDDRLEDAEAFGLDCSKYDEEELNALKNKLQQNIKWYRFIFSFRNEYLPHFESLMDKIPSIFKMSGRLNLQTFSIPLASSVINKISKTERSIEIDKALCDHLARIISTSDKQFETGFFILKKEVQPFMLSLVCKDLYQKITGANKDEDMIKAIENEDGTKIDDIISKYTDEIFSKVSKETRKFVEEELITNDDRRKLFALSDVKNPLTLSEVKDLSSKQELRFLNIVDYSNTSNLEILHDRLLKPLLVSRKKRREEEEKQILEKKAARTRNKFLIYAAIAFAAGIAILYILLNSYAPFLEDVNKVQLEKLSSDINKNSIGALMEVMKYQKSVNSIGEIGGIDFLPNFVDPLMATKENLNDSILIAFKDKPFFISFPDTSKSAFIISPACNFKSMPVLSEQNTDSNKLDQKTDSVTYEFFKLNDASIPSYTSLGKTKLFESIKKNNYILIFRYNNPKFSPDEKYFLIPSGNSFALLKREDILNGTFKYKNLEYAEKDILFSRFLIDSKLLLFVKTNQYSVTDRYVSKTEDPAKLMKLKIPDDNLLINAYLEKNNNIVYCTSESEGEDVNYSFFNENSEKPLYKIKGGQTKSYIGTNSFVTIINNTIKILDLNNFKTDSAEIKMNEPDRLFIIENKNQFVISNRFGDVHFYSTPDINKELHFKFKNDSNEVDHMTLAFASLTEFGNKILISYQNIVRIYDLDKKGKDSSFKKCDFGFLKMNLQYAYFNNDTSVSLIDNMGNIVKWYYEKESPKSIDQLQTYYNDFTRIYGNKNFIFTDQFLEVDSIKKENW